MRLVLRAGLALVVWNLVCWPLLPVYGQGLAPVAGVLWYGLGAGGVALPLWHVADLLLAMETRLLTLTRPEGYDLALPLTR